MEIQVLRADLCDSAPVKKNLARFHVRKTEFSRYVSLCSRLSEVTRLLLELYNTHTPNSLSMEELPPDVSRVLRGGNGAVPGVVPRAGGGEGLYIAPRHTELLYNTVDDASGLLFRGTGHCTEVQQVQ